MLRVCDCPESGLANRVGSIDLRLMNRYTAVHSDPIVWNERETPETAALQIIDQRQRYGDYSSILSGKSRYYRKTAERNHHYQWYKGNRNLYQGRKRNSCQSDSKRLLWGDCGRKGRDSCWNYRASLHGGGTIGNYQTNVKGGGQYEKENEKTCGSWSGNCNDRFHAAWMRRKMERQVMEKSSSVSQPGMTQPHWTASRNVSINLMRARIRLKLYWKDGDLILIQR